MSVSFFGDFDTTETIHIPFNTFTSDDPSASSTITDLVAGDIEIHKDGAVAQRTSDAGVTVSINFDGVTGNHMVHIDLSDNTDAGFYADGSRYQVRMEGTTIDGATINAWIGAFSIGCVLRPTTAGNKIDVSATGEAGLDFDNIKDATGAHTLTNITVPTVTTNSDMRGTDSAALASVWTAARAGALTDWIDGGRLDLLLDAIPTTAMRGTDSAALASVWTAARAGALTDWIDGGRLDLLLDAIPTTAMRGTDSAALAATWTAARAGALTDWINGGRLDLILDTINTNTAGGGDASAANQTTMITHLTDLKGTSFVKATHSNKAIIDRGNAAWTTGGGLSGSNAITITVQDGDGNNIVECAVEVWDQAGTTFYERQTSNSNGQVVSNMDDGTYTIKMHKAGYTFTNQTLVVSAAAAVTYTGTVFTPGTPASVNECQVYDWMFGQDKNPVAAVTATAEIIELPYDSGEEIHSGEEISGTYSVANGYIYWDIVQGATVRFKIDAFGVDKKIVIPTSVNARLTDVAEV